MWKLGPGKTVLLAAAVLLGLGYTPLTLTNSVGALVARSTGLLWESCSRPPIPRDPIKAAILNVTSDFEELSHLISDFLRQPGMDPAVGEQFKAFLTEKAARSYPRLETTLDWLLSIYKFLFPFLIISMAAKLSSSSAESGAAAAAAEAGAGAARAAQAGQRQPAQRQALPPPGIQAPRQLALAGSVAERSSSLSPTAPLTPVEGLRQQQQQQQQQQHPSVRTQRASSLLGATGSAAVEGAKQRRAAAEIHARAY